MKSKSEKDDKDSVRRLRALARFARRCQAEMFFAFGPVYDLTNTPPKPPPRLYHYTNAQGLMGILKSGTLHASNLKAVNDKGELQYGFDLIKKALLAKAQSSKTTQMGRRLFSHFAEFVNPYAIVGEMGVCLDVYSVAFCEDGDCLPQWRAYSSQASGYCIGFSGDSLSKIFGEGIVLVPVIYDQKQQSGIIKSLMNALECVVPYLESSNEQTRDLYFMQATAHVGLLFSFIGTVFKSSDFQSEHEWRIIVHNEIKMSRYVRETEFRVSQNGTLIPFVKLVPRRNRKLPIVSIAMGSTTPHEVNSYSLRLLLNTQNYRDVQVVKSSVSLRY